jgi:stage IV sporulation protein A
MAEAAEIGTRKVIAEHATIGLVVTTDGTVTDLPRGAYEEAEERVVTELKELGKPFLLLVNSAQPQSAEAQALGKELGEKYGVTTLVVSCLELGQSAVLDILQSVLYEFPLEELALTLPPWVEALPKDHPIQEEIYGAIRGAMGDLRRIRDVSPVVERIGQCPRLSEARVTALRLGSGQAAAVLDLPRALFYDTLSQQTGFAIPDDGALFRLLAELGGQQEKYRRVAAAMEEVRATGYGVVLPSPQEMTLEEPEVVRQGSRHGVRLRAKAPSIHLLRADIQAEVSPMVGSEEQSADMLAYLRQEFQGDPEKIWQSNLFGRSFHELISEDLSAKLRHLPEDAREKLRLTLERVINEGSGGLIVIIL